MDAVAGNADDALDDKESGFGGRNKDNDVAAPGIAVGNEFVDQAGLWRQAHPIDKDVIADQQGFHHGRGWNLKGLHTEGDDEQANDEHRSDGGNKLQRRFLGLFRLLFLFYFFRQLIPVLIRPASRRQAHNPSPAHIAEHMQDAGT